MTTQQWFKRMKFGTYKSGMELICILVIAVLAVPVVHATNKGGGCIVNRDEVLHDMERGMSDSDLLEKYKGCKSENNNDDSNINSNDVGDFNCKGNKCASTIKITDTGDTFWEAITSCGYHPQRKELTCPIEIRQPDGYGGTPALQPAGSFEYVQFCVDFGTGLEPINISGVHVHDEAFGEEPNWYFSAVVAANEKLFSEPLDGKTLRGRAILSWAISPAEDCEFIPIFGNQADFRFRLDP